MYILDTDHVTLVQRGNEPLGQRLTLLPPHQLATTVITYEEQISGRLAVVRRARRGDERIDAYFWLQRTLDFFCRIPVISFDRKAAEIYDTLVVDKIRIGTQDLLISAVALANNGVLLTRNQRDFQKVAHLKFEDWSF